MDRRSFIKNTALTGITIPALAATTFTSAERKNIVEENFPISEITIEQMQQKMQSGELTSRSVCELYLKRIAEIDESGPKLNAIIELNPEALSIADKMDEERKAGKIRGMMHGIPVLIKDNTDTGDNMMTTAGSLALFGHKAKEDAFIVKKLREAGAIILGKTNLSEWSNFRSSHSASGWSSRGGQTRNACVVDRNPSGSSSGSAVAVAANLCAVAVGTETDGSVISPSSHNGVVGIKPTVGLLSRSGIIPISKTQDTAGPITRTVRDAAILLSVMTGVDEKDAATKQSLNRESNDYLKFLSDDRLNGKRIGVEKSFFDGRPQIVGLFKDALEIIKKKGAAIIEVDLLKSFHKIDYQEYSILKYEFKDGLNRYLAGSNAKLRSLEEIIAFNKENAEKVMPYFDQEIFEASQALGDLSSKEYIQAFKKREDVRRLIDKTMKDNRLNAICGVSTGLPGMIDLINGDYDTGFYFCQPAATAGYPHITVPMGKVHELPVGISFMSGEYKEAEILSIAYGYEQATKKREAPKFLSSTFN